MELHSPPTKRAIQLGLLCLLLGMALSLPVRCATQQIRLDIHDDRVLHTVPARFHGTNFCALWNSTGDSPDTLKAFGQMGQSLVRFPGGVPCQWYDWKEPLATGWTELTPERAVRLAKTSDAAMVFQTNTANDGSGTNEKTRAKYTFDSSGVHAGQWAAWARQQAVPVAFWEIGNEPEADAPEVHKGSQEAVYQWYNAKFKEQAKAIKQADPKARVMGPAATNTWYWWHEHNLEKFMKAHGNRQGSGLVDAVSLHWYPDGGNGSWEQKRGAAQEWQSCMDYIRGALAQYDSRPLPLYITEWNWGGGDKNSSNRTLANALGNADCIGMFLRSGVSGETHFCLQKLDKNWGVLAMKGDCKPENAPNPTYFALVMASHLGGQVLDTRCSADEKNVLSAYATRNGGKLQVLLINKSAQAQTVALTFDRYQTAGKTVRVYTLQGANGSINDEEVLYNGVRAPQPAHSPLPDPQQVTAGTKFQQKVEPYAIVLVVFPV